MDIINPHYKAKAANIFTIRESEYANLLPTIQQILEPIEEIGFQISELEIRDFKTNSGELHKTVKYQLVIKLQKDVHEIDLSMAIPKLIDKNYIMINGRRKIPLFQLFDIPVVTRGKNIKLRTNVSAMTIIEEKSAPYIYVNFLRKKVPLGLLALCYFGAEGLNKKFKLDKVKNKKQGTLYEKLMYDVYCMWEASKDDDHDELIKELGGYYSQYNPRVKGEDAIYALDLIPKVDPMSFSFFNQDTIIDELFYIIENPEFDDTDFQNKRIRCWEYILLSKISKAIFDLCMSNRNAKKPKFNINSTQILSDCNVSDIVQFDFAINPIDELTKLSRTSLVGPGGFKRENVPEHLRDITDSMFGRMCPVDTPDRDNCGVLQNLIVNTDFDTNLRFTDKVLDEQPISIPVSMVPFLEKDDQTRLQMASSQMRQAIMLKDFEQPMIQSGCEGLYTDFSQFVKKAKKNGEVIYLDTKWLIVRYKDEEIEVFNIEYRKIYVGNMDLINIYVKVGDKFKAGDILAESNFCKDGKINIGRNLLTAVMVYYGHNYEDGIVISDRLVKEDAFTSIHYIDMSFVLPPNKVLLSLNEGGEYKPLPEVMETIKAGDIYAKLKEMPGGPLDFANIFSETIDLTAKKNILITDCNIYANEWNSELPEFKQWVESKIEIQKSKQDEFQKLLYELFPKQEASQFIKDNVVDKFSHVNKYKEKGEKVNGILIELSGIFTRPICVGDKIGNRHGNKGVISTIVPHEQMPMLEDGRHADICINPLGIISRMNIGQLFELHLSMSLYDLKKEAFKMLKDKVDQEKIIEYLNNYIDLIDNTKGKWYSKQFKKQLKVVDEEFIEKLCLVQAPFSGVTAKHLDEVVMKYTNTDFEYKIFDPVSGGHIQNTIACGYMHFFRMVHIAESRLAARGVGTYARKTLQPLAGRKNKGGQRCGEMETACLIGHDAPKNLFEFLTTKSDCIDLKNEYIKHTVESNIMPQIENSNDHVSESVKLLDACLTVIGITKDD